MDYDTWLENERLRKDPQEADFIRCKRCGSEIYDGEDYFFYEGTILCEDCIDELLNDIKNDARRIVGDDDE